MPLRNHRNRNFLSLSAGLALVWWPGALIAADPSANSAPGEHPLLVSQLGISSNPSATSKNAGTGQVAKWLGLKDDSGIFIGGVWDADSDFLISGGKVPGSWTFNSLFIANLGIDTEKLFGWKGGSFGIQFLQVNAQASDRKAGSAQGYDAIPPPDPQERTELAQLWVRQEFFDGKLAVRIGKMTPTADFNNVVRPVTTDDATHAIPAVSGLGYTPIFKNPALIGVMGSGVNTTGGVVVTLAPTKTTYLSYGLYDGNIARGVQTGLVAPQFTGYYFNVLEAGAAWELGPNKLPGNVGVGAWYQTGLLRRAGATDDGVDGFYLFGSQRLWFQHPEVDNSGVSAFYQFGLNEGTTMFFNQYFGMGLTGFGLVPARPKDSLGAGMSWAWLNPRLFNRSSELMFQGYYQANIVGGLYVEPAISFIPTPGGGSDLRAAWAATLRVTLLF